MAARFAVSTGVVAGAFAWNGTAGLKWALTSGGAGGQAVPGTADDVTFDSATSSASYTATRTVGTGIRSLSLAAPSSGTLTFVNASNMSLGVGGLTIAASGVTATGWTGTITVAASTNTLNTNGVALGAALTLNSASSNVTLGSDFSTVGAVTLSTSGASLLINGKVLTASALSSVSGATVNFGTTGSAVINATATGTVLSLAGTTTNPGAVTVNTAAFSTTVSTGASRVALTLTSSSSAPTITASGAVASLTLSGFTGTISNSGTAVFSSFTIPTGLGGGSGGWTGSGALAVDGTLITNGRALGGQLASYLSVGTTVTTTLGSDVSATTLNFADSSTLNIGTYTLTVGSITLSTFDVSFPTINMSGGRIVVTGTGTSDVVGGTFGANSIIEFTTAATRTLSNANSANLTVINSAGTLTLSGSSPVLGTIQASTGVLELPASQTTTVTNVVLTNSTLRSATNGTPATISKASGTVNFTGMTFRDITATGGATWLAPTSAGNVDGGGNTGINFTPAGAVTLTPALYANTNSFFSPTVAPGAVTLTPAPYANTNSFFSPTVSGSYALAPALYANTNSFYGPTVSGSYALAPALYANTNSFYSPEVSFGGQLLRPALYTNANIFYRPTVQRGADRLTPALFVNTNTVYGATVYLYPFHPNDLRPGGGSIVPGPRQPLPATPNAARGSMPLSSTAARQPLPAE